MKKLFHFFDKLEDRVRARLSRYQILYAIIGGVGIVLFWRGVWHTADYFMLYLSSWNSPNPSLDLGKAVWWDGPLSLVIGLVILLLIGVFVSNFIGNEMIISGLKGEKKLSEKIKKEPDKIERQKK